ncbi:hypothetical protein BDR26DRAFT_861104 [Obelidium mucronatum]|nr:hypothetical protein BDR26DRAFT_861104 [Obelidium mucronatum]
MEELAGSLRSLKNDLEVSLTKIRKARAAVSSTPKMTPATVVSYDDDHESAKLAALSDWPRFDKAYKYRYFISYRVNSDKDFALELYLRLEVELRKQIRFKADPFKGVFLDRECLVTGEDWRNGFVEGLKNAQVVLLIVSKGSLENMMLSDSSTDNLLLEWETALIAQEYHKCQILPIFVNNIRSQIVPGAFPNSRPAKVPGTNSCSLSARTILQLLLAFPDYVVWDGQNIDAVLNASFEAVSVFEANTSVSKRREECWKVEFEPDFWNCTTVALPNPLNNEEIELVSECAPWNVNWKELKLNLNQSRNSKLLKYFGKNLGLCNNLTVLDLSCQSLGDDGLSSLAIGFGMVPSAPLKSLNLSNNSISNKSISTLFDMLQVVAVNTLDISHNLIDNESSKTISTNLTNTSLKVLNISFNSFAFLHADCIMESKLEQLLVGWTDCLMGNEYMRCTSAGKLQILSVEDCNISDEGISYLKGDSNLQELDLSANAQIQNYSTMACLSNALHFGATSLRILRLNNIPMSEKNAFKLLVKGVTGGGHIQELHVKSCSLVADNVIEDAQLLLSHIVRLDISNNPLEYRGLMHLQALAADTKNLIELCLSNCGMSDAEVYKSFGHLPFVSLWGISVGGMYL